jgi:hypothetical protein
MALGRRHIGACLLDSRAVDSIIDPNENLAGTHLLVVLDHYGYNIPADLRSNHHCLVVTVVAAVVVVLVAWGLPPFQGSTEKTENAYVHGRAVRGRRLGAGFPQ